MKVIYRIPGKEPFSYFEAEVMHADTEKPEQIAYKFDMFLQAFKTGDGLPKKDWDALLDGYLRDGVVDVDLHAKCNKEQQTMLATIKRSLARINYGNRNSDKN